MTSNEGLGPFMYSMIFGQLITALTGFFTFLKELFITSLELSAELEYYQYTQDFLKQQILISANRINVNKDTSYNRWLRLGEEYKQDDDNDSYNLANGTHLFLYKRRLLWITKGFAPGTGSPNIIINIPFGTIEFANKLLEEIKRAYKGADGKLRVFTSSDGYGNAWVPQLMEKRRLETVVMPEGIKDAIIKDYQWFRQNAEWYKSKGIPYHRGYLFAGLPGTGKTSLALSLASHFNCSVYLLPVTKLFESTRINTMIRGIGKGSIVLIEDIDRMAEIASQKNKKENVGDPMILLKEAIGNSNSDIHECFRNLLQIMDGVMTPTDTIFILTTNNPQDINPALLRTGRVDRKYEFGYATSEQVKELFLQFFPEEDDLALSFAENICDDVVMADIQEHLIRNVDDAISASKFVKIEFELKDYERNIDID